jgi:hypothetical protein
VDGLGDSTHPRRVSHVDKKQILDALHMIGDPLTQTPD